MRSKFRSRLQDLAASPWPRRPQQRTSVPFPPMSATTTIIEIHRDGAWHPAATLQELGSDRCRFDYLPAYAFGADPIPLAHHLPLNFEPDRLVEGPTGAHPDRRAPALLYDLTPQGPGRRYLQRHFGLADHDDSILPLVMAGACNPIGCLRLSSAVHFASALSGARRDSVSERGFGLNHIVAHPKIFIGHLRRYAMLAAGTTGVQGEAPKFLLSTDAHGQWFPDMALPDHLAAEHWMMKLPRGGAGADRAVLRNEAGYLRLAARCGLRVTSEPEVFGDMLFVRRFDRQVVEGTVHRLTQESLASICDLRGFGRRPSQHELLAGLRSAVTDPLGETIEFLKRDVLNLAMGNVDNHPRNTAVQRLRSGVVRLTPLFDFAPMFLDPDGLVRACQWRQGGKVQRNWTEVIDFLEVDDSEREIIAREMAAFAHIVASIPSLAAESEIDAAIVGRCRMYTEQQAEDLATIHG